MKNTILKRIGVGVAMLGLVLALVPVLANNVSALSAITTSLDVGSTGSDVRTLQQFLSLDSAIYPQGLVTGYYGVLTQAAVSRFQSRYGIDMVGRVGPITRQKINELIVSGGFGGGTGTVSGAAAPMIMNPTVSTVFVTTIFNSDGSTNSQTTTGNVLPIGTTNIGNTTQTITERAIVSWNTDKPTRGKVFYSTTPLVTSESSSPTMEPSISGNVMEDTTYATSKSINLNALSGVSTYYYMIEAIDTNGNVSVTWPTTFPTR